VRIKYIIPFPLDADGLERRRAGIPYDVLRPGTEVEVSAVKNSFAMDHPQAGASYYEVMLLEMYVIEAGITAEQDGYDAVVVDSTSDSGLAVLRSRLSIPVVAEGTAALALAATISKRFSVIIYEDINRFIVEKILDEHKLWQRCASIRALKIVGDFNHLLDHDFDSRVARFVEVATAAVSEDGADAIVLGSGTMYQAAAPLAQALKIPVVNPGPAAIKLAETLVDLGLSHSKLAWRSPAILQDEKYHSLVAHSHSSPRTLVDPGSVGG
jgi:allantoin racemase